MTALRVYGVSAPEQSVLRFAANAGGTAEGNAFRPELWDDGRYFFCLKSPTKALVTFQEENKK